MVPGAAGDRVCGECGLRTGAIACPRCGAATRDVAGLRRRLAVQDAAEPKAPWRPPGILVWVFALGLLRGLVAGFWPWVLIMSALLIVTLYLRRR
jgi:hypothetical protein